MRPHPVVLLFSLVACTPEPTRSEPPDADTDVDTDTDADADADADTDAPTACDATVTQVWPEDGAVAVLPDTPIEVRFSAPIGPTDPWSLQLAGLPGQATLHPDGSGATFAPSMPLPPSATLQVDASVCGAARSTTFTTLHGPIAHASVEGRTWAVSYAGVNFITPSIANTLDPADWILLQVPSIDPASQQMSTIAGLGDGSYPAPVCENSFDAGSADFSANPVFSVGPTDFVIPWDADQVTIEDFEVEAIVGPGGGFLTDIVLLGNLDTRGVTSVSGICQLSALLGSPCQPCRDGMIRCLPVYAEAVQADAWPDVDIAATCGI